MLSFRAFTTLYWADYLVTALGLAAGLGRELNPLVAQVTDPWLLLAYKLLLFLAFLTGLQFLRPRLRIWPVSLALVAYGFIVGWNLGQILIEMVLRAPFG